jgi:antimicrobial peptide system SdpA family protein
MKYISRDHLIIILKLFLIFIWGGFIFFIANRLVQNTTISMNKLAKKRTVNFFPEGWGFFTKNPKGYVNYVYRYDKNKNRWKLINQARFSSSNSFGLSRRATQLSIVMANLIKKSNSEQWEKINHLQIKRLLSGSVFEDGKVYPMIVNAKIPVLYGKILIIRKKLLPWEWRNFKDSFTMPVHYIKMTIDGR